MTKIVQAKLRYLRIAPKKVRLVAGVIKGMPVDRAEAELSARAKRGAQALVGLLRSAVSNATNVHKLDRQSLVVKGVRVDPGPPFKRVLPRAMGRATPLWKRTSHVTITLEAKEGFMAAAPKVIARERQKVAKPAIAAEKQRPAAKAPKKERLLGRAARGFSQKIFRRKAI
jgi:large subunit ribosomal protein L22